MRKNEEVGIKANIDNQSKIIIIYLLKRSSLVALIADWLDLDKSIKSKF